jgi:glycerol-3-phosphate acyltransferase PlsY
MTSVAFVLIAFLCGSIPFSVWLTRLFLRVDVRQYGDGNPGAANVFKAGSKTIGLLALILDISKSAAPVGLAYNTLGIRGIPLFFIAIAPVLGHVFSPFLRFRGGKAIATVLGVWIGLMAWEAALVGVIATLIGITLTAVTGWAVMLGMIGILATLLIWNPDPIFLLVWVGETLILSWTLRADLHQCPRLRPWLTKHHIPAKK